MKSWIFYPVVAALAAGLIGLSLGGRAFPAPPQPQSGVLDSGALTFDAAALSQTLPGEGLALYTPLERGAPAGLRVAIEPGRGDPRGDEAGARLLLAPAAQAALPQGPIQAQISYRPLIESTAAGWAIALEDGGERQWVRLETPLEAATLVANLPAPRGPVTAIAFRPINPNPQLRYGVEINRLTLRPAPAP